MDNNINNILNKPIGVFFKNLDAIECTLSRNIGDYGSTFDGYGTPIGSLADPMYTIDNFIPAFKNDLYKNTYSNYIDYIIHVHNSVKLVNLFNGLPDALEPQSIIIDKTKVIEDYDIMSGAASTELGASIDTRLGVIGNYYLSRALISTAIINSERNNVEGKAISYSMRELGLKNENISQITKCWQFNQYGRIPLTPFLSETASPIEPSDYGSKFGRGDDISAYEVWYKTLDEFTARSIIKAKSGIEYDRVSEYDMVNDIDTLYEIYKEKIKEISYLNSNRFKPFITPNEDTSYFQRYVFNGFNNELLSGRVLLTYSEKETDENQYVTMNTFNEGINYGIHESLYNTRDTSDLIGLTNDMFHQGAMRTLISRFHTSDIDETNTKETQTNISRTFGMSHGRNLLKVKGSGDNLSVDNEKINGYENPYCRVWTYHHQYNTLLDTIRPFTDEKSIMNQTDLSKQYNWKVFASQIDGDEDFGDGRIRLDKYSKINKWNGLINIAPTNPNQKDKNIEIKDCMFSIENLAWKDYRDGEYGLSKEQRGPMGGRIMWFPPYNLKFNESVNVQWNENAIIGRGEKIYTYNNTDRSGSLSFSIIVDHPSIIDYYKERFNDNVGGDSVDEITNPHQRLLRFFAGCEILNAQELDIKTDEYEYPELPQGLEEPPIEPTYDTVTEEEKIIFFVFYPNNYSGCDDRERSSSKVKAMKYLANGLGTQMFVDDTNYADDFAVPYTVYNGGYGGYEVGNSGVSVVTTEVLNGSKTDLVNSKNGNKGRKMGQTVGDDASNNFILLTNFVRPNKYNGTSEWYYRTDKKYSNQRLIQGNYVDNKSYQLNSYQGLNTVKQTFSDSESTDYNSIYSFIDVFCALDSQMDNVMTKRGIVNTEQRDIIKSKLENYKVKSIKGMGMASSHGYSSSNNVLNKDRFNSVIDWLQTYSMFQGVSASIDDSGNQVGNVTQGSSSTNDVNDLLPKLYRSAKIEIILEREKQILVQDTRAEEEVSMSDESVQVMTKFGNVDVPKKILDRINTLDDDTERTKAIEDMLMANPYQFFDYRTPEFDEQLRLWQEEANKVKVKNSKSDAIKYSTKRYDNESYFFENLEIASPFLHNLISEKVKYFDPAFHSITPEGFNARLTFLQQCTRQGSTLSANEDGMNSGNANNLAFGRPPICILRIGNFYNTKIIIDNLSFDFENWDLNQEGIGVQPMLCHINMSFRFLGGQDLSNPIPRLQNALSFNYYANTSVYDNRSEMVEYDKDNNGKITKYRAINR